MSFAVILRTQDYPGIPRSVPAVLAYNPPKNSTVLAYCDFYGNTNEEEFENLKPYLTDGFIPMSWDNDTIMAWKGEFKKILGIPCGKIKLFS